MNQINVFLRAILILALPTIHALQERIALDRTEYFAKVDVNVSWSINTESQKIYVEIISQMRYESESWIAFGISDTGGINFKLNLLYFSNVLINTEHKIKSNIHIAHKIEISKSFSSNYYYLNSLII